MSLEYTRQCDSCKKFVPCGMTYFTERMWFCDGCSVEIVPSPPSEVSKLYDELAGDYKNVSKRLENLSKDTLINLTASKDELIDISRAIGIALVVGEVDTEIDNKRIVIKVKK